MSPSAGSLPANLWNLCRYSWRCTVRRLSGWCVRVGQSPGHQVQHLRPGQRQLQRKLRPGRQRRLVVQQVWLLNDERMCPSLTVIHYSIKIIKYSFLFIFHLSPGVTQPILMACTTPMGTTVRWQMMVWFGTLGEDGGTPWRPPSWSCGLSTSKLTLSTTPMLFTAHHFPRSDMSRSQILLAWLFWEACITWCEIIFSKYRNTPKHKYHLVTLSNPMWTCTLTTNQSSWHLQTNMLIRLCLGGENSLALNRVNMAKMNQIFNHPNFWSGLKFKCTLSQDSETFKDLRTCETKLAVFRDMSVARGSSVHSQLSVLWRKWKFGVRVCVVTQADTLNWRWRKGPLSCHLKRLWQFP